MSSNHKRKEQRRKERKKTYKNKPKTIKKMAIGTYISIITLNVNGLNALTKRHWLAEWIQKQDPYTSCLQETHFIPRDTKDWKWENGKRYSMQWKSKESWSSNTHIGQNRLLNKDSYKRLGRTLLNDQGINPRRRYNNYIYICPNYRGTSICKVNPKIH